MSNSMHRLAKRPIAMAIDTPATDLGQIDRNPAAGNRHTGPSRYGLRMTTARAPGLGRPAGPTFRAPTRAFGERFGDFSGVMAASDSKIVE